MDKSENEKLAEQVNRMADALDGLGAELRRQTEAINQRSAARSFATLRSKFVGHTQRASRYPIVNVKHEEFEVMIKVIEFGQTAETIDLIIYLASSHMGTSRKYTCRYYHTDRGHIALVIDPDARYENEWVNEVSLAVIAKYGDKVLDALAGLS